jgi:hypothetical protein
MATTLVCWQVGGCRELEAASSSNLDGERSPSDAREVKSLQWKRLHGLQDATA